METWREVYYAACAIGAGRGPLDTIRTIRKFWRQDLRNLVHGCDMDFFCAVHLASEFAACRIHYNLESVLADLEAPKIDSPTRRSLLGDPSGCIDFNPSHGSTRI